MSPIVKGTYGRNVEAVASVRLNVFKDLFDELLGEWLDEQVKAGGSAVLHGGALAGEIDAMGGEQGRVIWHTERDGRVCPDCKALDGSLMTMSEFMDIKYTTVCGGDCRCWPVKQ